MTETEQRIAIAEFCGWKWYRMPNRTSDARIYRCLFHPAIHEYDGQSPEWMVKADGSERICNLTFMECEGHVPDYFALIAIQDAVNQLAAQGWRCVANSGTDGTWECFFTKGDADSIIPREGDHYGAGDTLPKAIAEALLRTIGKWRDEPVKPL